MRSIFRFEKNEGGVCINTFADIAKKDIFLVNRSVTDKELIELNNLIITKDNSLNSPKQE